MTIQSPIVLASGFFSQLFPGDTVPGTDTTAQASGNAALVLAGTALASGNAGISTGLTALASGNAGLVSASNKVPISGGYMTGQLFAASGVVVSGTLSRNGFNVVTVGDVETVTSTMIASGTIIDADVNISGAINATKLNFLQAGASAVARTVDSKLKDTVSVKDFGAVGDGTTDDYDAFTAATTYCNNNNKRSLLIPPDNYSLSQPWAAPAGGSYIPCKTTGAGATLNNTVIVSGGAGIEGLTVDGSPDCGFVFIRGQGSYHSYLVSKNNGSYGFYFGVASRQHLTVNSVTNFTVGQIVTGTTSGAFGTITRITGNVLELVKCNFGSTPNFFSVAETITQVTPAASTTVSSILKPYGSNYQVTRATFEQLIAVSNGNKGFYWDGTATANRSWMNASTIISPASVSNGGKGWVVSSFVGPGGSSEHNYNTFININCEGNADQSLQDNTGRQNTYIGGHFVDLDGSGQSVSISDSYNFQLGGRYLGTVNFNGPFSIRNMDTGGVAGSISGLDSFQTNAFQADGPAFMPSGWSILPASKIAVTIGAGNTTNHLINVDFGSLNVSNYINYRIFLGGFRNQSGGYATINHAQLIGQICSSTTPLNAINYTAVGLNGVTVNSVTINSSGLATFNLNTTGSIFNWQVIVEFWSVDGNDPR